MLGLGSAFALESLDPRVRREETLRRIFRLPVLARIPRERRPASRKLPMRPGELSPAAQESYRMLRVALGARGHTDGTRSMMVTGSTRSEGKSTVALNLAATLAFSGHKVILGRGRPEAPLAGWPRLTCWPSAANVAPPAC